MHKKPKRYSVFSLIRNALSYHENWQPAWRSPEPKKEYAAIIIGGGGHGLATAFYLAKKHNMKNIAVVEKGCIGGGNTGNLVLNNTDAFADDDSRWNDTTPSSTVWTMGSGATVNYNGRTFVAYLFSEKQGYIKFSSFGNSFRNYIISQPLTC